MTNADRREVELIMGKFTTTVDGLGRSKRDLKLVLRLNPHWPEVLRIALGEYLRSFDTTLQGFDMREAEVARALNEVAPQEE